MLTKVGGSEKIYKGGWPYREVVYGRRVFKLPAQFGIRSQK